MLRNLPIEWALVVALVTTACSDVSSPPVRSRPALAQAGATAWAYSQNGYGLTPVGWRPAAKGGVIQAGHGLTISSGYLREQDAAGQFVRNLGAVSTWPGDTLAGAPIPALGSGWITFAYWNRPSGHAITADTARWIVPPVPARWDSQTIFLFNGIDLPTGWILQPVLAYGPTIAGGGQYWSASCFNVLQTGQNWAATTPFQVIPGDTVVGVTDSAPPGSGNSYYCSVHASNGYGATLYDVGSWPEYTQAVETLEAYNLLTCNDYPNTDSTAFKSIGLYTHGGVPTLSWTARTYWWDCGQYTNIVSNADPGGEVDVFYRTPPPPSLIDSIYAAAPYYYAEPLGGYAPYTYLWEWCAINCSGGGGNAPAASGVSPNQVAKGWQVLSTSASVYWTMSGSILRSTVTDTHSQRAVATYNVP
jgi:hypothetical protein